MSGLQDQVIPIHFGKGLDTKTDSKLVVAGKMLRLQDAVFTQINQCDKRNGYQTITNAVLGGGTITSPRLLATFQNELVCADSALGQLLSYSPTDACWVPKGNYVPVQVKNTIVSRYVGAVSGGVGHFNTTAAAIGNIAAFTWSTRIPPSGALCPMASVVDLSTGVSLTSDSILSTTTSSSSNQSQAVVLGGSALAIIFATTSDIKICIVNLSTGAIGAPSTILTDGTIFGLRVAATAGGGALFYSNETAYKIVTIDTAGAITNSVTGATITPGSSAISVESFTGNIWVYWSDGGGSALSYAVYSPSLSSVLGATAIVTPASFPLALIPVEVSSGTQKLLYSIQVANGATTQIDVLFTTNQIQVNSAGSVGSTSLFVQNLFPSSNVFTISGVKYIRCTYKSQVQPTYFILKVSDASIFAKLLPGSADPVSALPSSPIQVSSSQVLIPGGEAYTVYNIGGTNALLTGSSYSTIDGGSTEAYQALASNNNLILNGGQIYSYDGRSIAELGFHLFPCIISATPIGSGGSMAAGAYEYFALYRFYDEVGNIYASGISVVISATTTGSSSSVSLVISYLAQTAKQSGNLKCLVEIYRTTANGTSAFLIAKKINDPTTSNFTYVDAAADTGLTSATPLYTTGGILENSAPPAAMAMTLHNDRLWMIPSESPNEIWYSKTFVTTDGVNFSDLLTVEVDAKGGLGVALASMDDKLVVLEENLPIVFSGDGANETGAGSTLSNPQPIPSDVGCSQSKGVIVFPKGIIFKTTKGIYLLDRSLSVTYLGMEVEAYNAQSISAATLISTKSQIRFLTSSGLTLVYDYIFNQWSTFTNHQGYSSVSWAGSYVYARTDGDIYQESAGYYLDKSTSFAPLAQTAWLALSSVQNFERVKRFGMLGNFANGASANHGVQVSAAYDFINSFSTPVPFLLGSSNASGPYQYRERLPRQKCDTISLIIQEVTTGDSAESITFTDMSFDAGMKKGIKKMSTNSSVA